MRIAPSILDADLLELGSSLTMLERGKASWLHLDVMDGHFVPVLTFGPVLARAIARRTQLPMEAHLMVKNPADHIKAFADAGVKRLIVHVEGTLHLHQLLKQIREAGMLCGVVVNPGTPIEAVSEVIDDVSLLLLMSVNPGWGGQKFIRPVLEKVKKARRMIDERGLKVDLEIDGGVNQSTIRECADAGADLFVVGSGIFKAADPEGSLRELVEM